MEGKSLDDFSKARKYYGIFSAILISWSMVGIDVDSVQAVGSKITLKNPESIPYALIALVLYFSYRLSIEWAILYPQEKKNKFLRIDLFVSHSIGFFVCQFISIFQSVIDVDR